MVMQPGAGALPTKPPSYTESLPPAYESAGYDNPVYGPNPSTHGSHPDVANNPVYGANTSTHGYYPNAASNPVYGAPTPYGFHHSDAASGATALSPNYTPPSVVSSGLDGGHAYDM